ncbi:unnamed protein product [Ostreobium quekettii]|uniref:RING-type E3 ubiquitin transferase n=1 Tax=Ostreobium quekettii TaxID=121088 RepID=A0A8S1IZN2_9CHLO|nr:unnamed protein product [Ostreobium quekettii]|eukprot:evm.model.scf_671.3 EVM.evm.TU.scf_671.3   scf_671:55921-61569(+)
MLGRVVDAARRRASFTTRRKEKRGKAEGVPHEVVSYDDKLSRKSKSRSCDAPPVPIFHRRVFSLPGDAFYPDQRPVCVLPKGASSELIRGLQSGHKSDQRHAVRVLRDGEAGLRVAFVGAGGVPVLMEHLAVKRPPKEALQCLVAFLQDAKREVHSQFVEHGAVAVVARQLSGGTRSCRKWAARAVPQLVAGDPDAQGEVARAGGVESLMAMLHSAKEKRREAAAAALASLVKDSQSAQRQIALHDRLADLSTMLPKGRAGTRSMVAATLANVIATNPACQARVAEYGGEHLLKAMREVDEGLRRESLRALAYITAVPEGQRIVVEKEGVRKLLELIDSGQAMHEEWALEVLLNLTGKEGLTPQSVWEDLVNCLLKVLLKGTAGCQEKSLRVLAQLSQLRSSSEWQVGEGQLIPLSVSLLTKRSMAIQEGAACVLANIADVQENRRKIYDSGAIKPLVAILGGQHLSTRQWAGLTLSKLASSDDAVLDMVNEGVVHTLVQVLSEGSSSREKWAVQTLSTIAKAPHPWVRGLMCNAGSIDVLLSFVSSSAPNMQLASLACLANLVDGHQESQQMVLGVGIQPLIQLLLRGEPELQGAAVHVLAHLSHLEPCKCDVSGWPSIRALGRLLQADEPLVRMGAATVLADVATIRGPATVMQKMHNILILLVDILQADMREARCQAARAIGNLAMHSQEARSQFGACSQVLTGLVDALDEPGTSGLNTRAQAAHALANLMFQEPTLQTRVAQLGVVRPLVDMLHVDNHDCNVQAAKALAHLVEDHHANNVAVSLGGAMDRLLQLLAAGSDEAKCHSAHVIANLTHHSTSNQLAIVNGRGVPSLVSLLNGDDDVARGHAVRAFANLASSNEVAVVDSRRAAIAPLVSIISSSNDKCREQAARALANLACSGDEQELIAKEQGIPPLVHLVRTGTPPAREQAARALANLSCKDVNLPAIIEHDGIRALVSLLRSPNGPCRKQAAGALANLACNNSDNGTAVVEAGGVPDLVELLSSDSEACREQAVRAVGNLACTYDNQQALIQEGAAKQLIALLKRIEEREGCKQRVVRALANLAADNEDNQLVIIREGAVEPLMQMLSNRDSRFQEETKRALMLLACGTDIKLQPTMDDSADDIQSGRAKVMAAVLGVRLNFRNSGVARMHFMAESGDNEGVPRQLLCPITHELMEDPVVAHDGHTYEKSAIVEWFRNRNSSPMTNEQLKSTHVVPNLLLHAIISDFQESKGGRGAGP